MQTQTQSRMKRIQCVHILLLEEMLLTFGTKLIAFFFCCGLNAALEFRRVT